MPVHTHRRPQCHSRKYRDPGLSRGKHIPASHRPESTPELQATSKLPKLTNERFRSRSLGHGPARRVCEETRARACGLCRGRQGRAAQPHATCGGHALLQRRPYVAPGTREPLTGSVIRGRESRAGHRQRAQARPCDWDSGPPRHRTAQRFLHRVTRVRTGQRVHSSTHPQKKRTHKSTQNPYADARGSGGHKSRPTTRTSRVRRRVSG